MVDPQVTDPIPLGELTAEEGVSPKAWYDTLEVVIDGKSISLQQDEPKMDEPTSPLPPTTVTFDRNKAARFAELLVKRYPLLNGIGKGHHKFMHLATIARYIYDLALSEVPDESVVSVGQMTFPLNGTPPSHDEVRGWLGIAPMDVPGNSILHGGSYLAVPAFNVIALAGRSVCGL